MNRTSTAAVLRISRRDVGRNRWRSVLIGLLIMLPVAAMVGGLTYYRTTTPTNETVATWSAGAADWIVHPNSAQATTELLRATLPANSTIEPRSSSSGVVALPGRRVSVWVRSTNLEGLGHGTLELTAGRLPAAADEAAISQPLASLANLGVGDSIEVEGSPRRPIVGLLVDPGQLSNQIVLVHHMLAETTDPSTHSWLVLLPDGAPADALERMFSGQGQLFSATPRAGWPRVSGDVTLAMLLGGAMGLIGTVLIGAAAFAVSIRRRQRELGMLAAAGASRRQLAGTVLGEGLLVATAAVAAALVVGIGLVMLATPWLDQITDHRNGPVVIDIVAAASAAAVGLAAGVAAALMPAWTAARLPPLVALSGRRPPASSARRTLATGLSLIGLAAAMTAVGTSILLADRENGIAPFLLGGGTILGVLGCGACSPWLVERLEWLSRHLPLPTRIALREAARARSRTAPIVTATLAGLAAAIAISTIISTTGAHLNDDWQSPVRPDQLWIVGREAAQVGPQVASEMSAVAAAAAPPLDMVSIDGLEPWERRLEVGITRDGEAAPLPVPGEDSDGLLDDRRWFTAGIGTPALLAAMGAPATAAHELEAGFVVLLADEPFDARSARLTVWETVCTPDNDGGESCSSSIARTEQVPARAYAVHPSADAKSFPDALISEQVAGRFGFEARDGNGFLIRLDHTVTEADIAAAASLIADSPSAWVYPTLGIADPSPIARLILGVVSVLLALVITAIAVALGEAEARPDQRTLIAIGADPGLRRRIVAARAAVVALLAAVLAVPAGLLPVWGLFASRDQAIVVPVPEIAAIILLLPLVAVVGGLLLSRPLPHWSALRDVSAG